MNLLSKEDKKVIDHWLTKFPEDKKQSAVIAALTQVQETNGGWLTTELMDEVADYLQIPKINVYEVATFYSMFELKPVGKYKIEICTNISCMLCDSDAIVKRLQDRLGIKLGETTPDGKITLKEVECIAACTAAPAIIVNGTYHEHLTPEKVDTILEGLR